MKNNSNFGQNSAVFKEKEYYREQIIKIVGEIEQEKILRCIYVFISDIIEEIKEKERLNDE